MDERVVAVLGALGSGKKGVCFSYTLSVARDVLGLRAYPSTFLISPDGIVRRVVERAEAWDSELWRPEILALVNPRSQ